MKIRIEDSEMENTLKKINKACLKFLDPITVEQTLPIITEETSRLLGADLTALYLEENSHLKKVAAFPVKSPLSVEPRKRGFTYRSYKEQKTFVLNKKEINRIHPELKEKNINSAICIPVSYQRKSIGVLLVISHREKKFIKNDLSLLNLFGSYASLAIRKARLYNDLKKALHTRDLFISMAAHELRTPLTAINGYVQLLYTKLSFANSKESRWMKQLLWETKRLTLLINELLEIDRIKKGSLQYIWKECSLTEIVDRAIRNVKFAFPKRDFVFDNKIKDSDLIIGDYDKLLQVTTNILDNAAKFSPAEKHVEITTSNADKYISVTVKDHGPGIPEDKLLNIFEGYITTHEDIPQGMGLGLFLVRNILKLHRGTIEIKTKLQKGTTVEIQLPKAR